MHRNDKLSAAWFILSKPVPQQNDFHSISKQKWVMLGEITIVGPALSSLDADLAFKQEAVTRSKDARKQAQMNAAAQEARGMLGACPFCIALCCCLHALPCCTPSCHVMPQSCAPTVCHAMSCHNHGSSCHVSHTCEASYMLFHNDAFRKAFLEPKSRSRSMQSMRSKLEDRQSYI